MKQKKSFLAGSCSLMKGLSFACRISGPWLIAGTVVLTAACGGGGGGGSADTAPSPQDTGVASGAGAIVVDDKFVPMDPTGAVPDTSLTAEQQHEIAKLLRVGIGIMGGGFGEEWAEGKGDAQGVLACAGGGTMAASQAGKVLVPGDKAIDLSAAEIEFVYKQCQGRELYFDGRSWVTTARFGANPSIQRTRAESLHVKSTVPGESFDRVYQGSQTWVSQTFEGKGAVNQVTYHPNSSVNDLVTGQVITALGGSRRWGGSYGNGNPYAMYFAESFNQLRFDLGGQSYTLNGTTMISGNLPPPHTAGVVEVTNAQGKLLGRIRYDMSKRMGALYFEPGNGPVREL